MRWAQQGIVCIWSTKPYFLVCDYHRLRGESCRHLHTTGPSEMFIITYQTTRCHNRK